MRIPDSMGGKVVLGQDNICLSSRVPLKSISCSENISRRPTLVRQGAGLWQAEAHASQPMGPR